MFERDSQIQKVGLKASVQVSPFPVVKSGQTELDGSKFPREVGNRELAQLTRQLAAGDAGPISHRERGLLLQMQKTMGNRYVSRLVEARRLPSASNPPSFGIGISAGHTNISRKPKNDDLPPVPRLAPPPSLILDVPGMTEAQLAKVLDDLKDPETKKYQAEQKAEEEAAKKKEMEEDATRSARFRNLREFILSNTTALNRADVADFLHKNFSPKDIQILRKHGLKWLGISERNHARENLLQALYDYKASEVGGTYINAPSPGEIKDRNRRELVLKTLRVMDLMRGGIFAAAGGYFAGEQGAKIGSTVDDLMQGAGGVAGARTGNGHPETSRIDEPAAIDRPLEPEPLAPTPDPISQDGPASESTPQTISTDAQTTARGQLVVGGLLRHEIAGGHPLERHVGLDDADLFERLNQQVNLREASTFTDVETAHAAIANLIEANGARIEAARISGDQVELRGEYSGTTGRWLTRGAQAPINVSGLVVILRPEPSIPWGFRIVTAYPAP
jgi:hypothetical protein